LFSCAFTAGAATIETTARAIAPMKNLTVFITTDNLTYFVKLNSEQ
jgi:hypothetical protein